MPNIGQDVIARISGGVQLVLCEVQMANFSRLIYLGGCTGQRMSDITQELNTLGWK